MESEVGRGTVMGETMLTAAVDRVGGLMILVSGLTGQTPWPDRVRRFDSTELLRDRVNPRVTNCCICGKGTRLG